MNVVITGATKGIGLAIAERLLGEGFHLAFCARNQSEIDALVEKWGEDFPQQRIVGKSCDMGKKEQIEEFASFLKEKMSHVDVLINNAGMFIPGEILSEKDGALDEMLNVNLLSAYHLSRLLVPGMVERQRGHVFNMCSVASIQAYPNGGSYSISKFALLGMSKVLREELKSKGVKVTSILPGATWSNSWQGVDLPKERLMEAEDIAMCVSNAIALSPSAVVEEIVIRPQLGDL